MSRTAAGSPNCSTTAGWDADAVRDDLRPTWSSNRYMPSGANSAACSASRPRRRRNRGRVERLRRGQPLRDRRWKLHLHVPGALSAGQGGASAQPGGGAGLIAGIEEARIAEWADLERPRELILVLAISSRIPCKRRSTTDSVDPTRHGSSPRTDGRYARVDGASLHPVQASVRWRLECPPPTPGRCAG